MIKLLYPKFWSHRGPISTLLTPISWLYRALGFIRKLIAKPIRFNAKVICIGNITVGGNGKTQIVESLAKYYRNKKSILVITKGYASSLKTAQLVSSDDLSKDIGDESKLLSEYVTVIATKKIKYLPSYVNKIKPEIIIFDDGLQNPHFIKDCKILVIDNIRGTGNGQIFPAGPLRIQSEVAIRECDAIIEIGNNIKEYSLIQNAVLSNKKPIFKAKIKLISKLKKQNEYFAFSAIGNPNRFFDTLREGGANIKYTQIFPNHHQFTQNDIVKLKNIAQKNNYTLITTKKDYVKIHNTTNIECAIVNVVFENQMEFIKKINETLY